MTTLLFQPFQTTIYSADRKPLYYVSTAYCEDGFSPTNWQEPEWETMVFPYRPDGVLSHKVELEQFRCESRKEAIAQHMFCVDKYALHF